MSEPNHDTAEYLEAWHQREFKIARCRDCETRLFPPRRICPHCWSESVEAVPIDGTGWLVSYSLPRQVVDVPPRPTGVIDLDGAGGVRALTKLEVAPEELAIGMRLRLAWDESGGTPTPVFTVDSEGTT